MYNKAMSKDAAETSLEGIRLTTQTIKGEDLFKEVFVDGQLDPRFRPIEEGGVFEFAKWLFREPYMKKRDVWFSILRLNGLIVGAADLVPTPSDPKALELMSVTIDHNLKGLRRSDNASEREIRLSERLLREVFQFVKKRGCTALYLSPIVPEGA